MKNFKRLIYAFIVIASIFTVNLNCLAVSGQTKIDVSGKSAFLFDYNSKTVIYSHNENDRKPIASMTKIMLLTLAYENVENGNLSLDETVTVSENAAGMGGSQVFLEKGGQYKVSDLLKSITVASANDASVCIAERLYGSEKNCVDEMNKKAKSLGLENTLFANCTGLPAPMQYSSAKDVAVIFSNLIRHDEYFNYSTIWTDKINHSKNSTDITNTNKLVKFYNGCDGGKTGHTSEAGFCLTATAKRGNMRLISVVINAPSSKDRFKDVSNMFNYGFDNYCNRCVVDCSVPLENKVKVLKSKQKEIEAAPKNNFYVFSNRNDKDEIDFDTKIFDVKAPIKKGDAVGEIIVYKNGVEYGKVDVVAMQNADKNNYFDCVDDVISNW